MSQIVQSKWRYKQVTTDCQLKSKLIPLTFTPNSQIKRDAVPQTKKWFWILDNTFHIWYQIPEPHNGGGGLNLLTGQYIDLCNIMIILYPSKLFNQIWFWLVSPSHVCMYLALGCLGMNFQTNLCFQNCVYSLIFEKWMCHLWRYKAQCSAIDNSLSQNKSCELLI